jgi:hypothetical protein
LDEETFEAIRRVGTHFKYVIGGYHKERDSIILGIRGTDEFPDGFPERHIEDFLVHETVHRVLERRVGGGKEIHDWFDHMEEMWKFEELTKLKEENAQLRTELRSRTVRREPDRMLVG